MFIRIDGMPSSKEISTRSGTDVISSWFPTTMKLEISQSDWKNKNMESKYATKEISVFNDEIKDDFRIYLREE